MIHRYSSREQSLGKHFLQDRLKQAVQYDRIAGFFSSSLLEIAGEEIENMPGKVRMVCNSTLDPLDVQTAKAAEMAITREWKLGIDAVFSEKAQPRLEKLYRLLSSGKLEVRVLPDSAFGLIHGKAGVITFPDGTQTSFLGSVNESKTAWRLNYELLWEDPSAEAVEWVQREFDVLWNGTSARPLSQAVVEDIQRLSKRKVISHQDWKTGRANPEPAVVESPVFRQHFGLWAHQKYFIKRAYEEHISGRGARFVLADQVGLGKTVQMAMAAMLMALKGDRPVLIIAPRTLLFQWQEEMMKLLRLPSAVWDGKAWVDENEVRYEQADPLKAILKCPRRFGIVSQGLIVRGGPLSEKLLERQYECVLVDEAHRSRRKNLREGAENEKADPNNLMRFLIQLSQCTRSMILGTATPVQLYPVEAYDLLSVLGAGSNHVLGDAFSKWNGPQKDIVFRVVQGTAFIHDKSMRWDWIRNPFPPAEENEQIFGVIRSSLNLSPIEYLLDQDRIIAIKPWDRQKIEYAEDMFIRHNPFVRSIVRRTRAFLENTINPETGEPYLDKVGVRLFGEEDQDAILLPGYLEDAYHTAEEFCRALGELMKGAGFIRTLLLRRMGSSIEAGLKTAHKMLGAGIILEEEEEEEDEDDDIQLSQGGIAARLTEREQKILQKLIFELEQNQEADPKLILLRRLLFEEGWADSGCIIFSQYFDTVSTFARQIAAGHPELNIGVYAGSGKSGVWNNGSFLRTAKDELKAKVQKGDIKILFGTDSASEGLNLQRLGTLINLDLPWNPTRLEQRKGRIQRIGQQRNEVWVYNMRYKGSVEDRVHQLLSQRLNHIFSLFGQIPDVLKDVWVDIAIGNKEKALERITQLELRSPFEIRYDQIENVDFESCSDVLSRVELTEILKMGW